MNCRLYFIGFLLPSREKARMRVPNHTLTFILSPVKGEEMK